VIATPLLYPATTPESTTVMALMTNPAASPVAGRPVRLEGTPIGRVNPGFFGGEDVIFRDKSGILPVDFLSMLGFLGDIYTGWRRIPKHLGKPGTVAGWFRRSMAGSIILKELDTTGGQLRVAAILLAGAALCHCHRRYDLFHGRARAGPHAAALDARHGR
jgi:hypothetical protein